MEVKKSKIFIFIVKALLLYSFIYETTLINFPNILSSRKIVLGLIFVYLLFRYKFNLKLILSFKEEKLKVIDKLCLIIFLIAMYTLILNFINNGNGSPIYRLLIYMVIYISLGTKFFSHIYNNVNEFFKSIIFCTCISSILVFMQQLSPYFRLFLVSSFKADNNIPFYVTIRAAIPGASGSALSMFIFLGMLACTYFIINNKKNITLYFIFLAIFMAATVLSGTSGIICGVFLILYIIIIMFKDLKIFRFFSGTAILGTMYIIIKKIFISNYSSSRIDRLIERITSFFKYGKNHEDIVALKNMYVSGISFKTIVGTGISRGTVGNNISCQHDSGYIQSYFGMGLICAIIFYLAIYKAMLKLLTYITNKNLKRVLFFLFLAIVIFEYKEPYCEYYIPLFVFFESAILFLKQNTINERS